MTVSPRPSRRLPAAALAAALSLSAAAALAAVAEGDYAGKTEDEIANSLEAQDYSVRKIESDDGYFEAYALLDGRRYEIYVDAKTGKVTRVKVDD